MNLVNRIGRRIQHLWSSRLESRFVAPFLDVQADRLAQDEQEIFEQAGVMLETAVKARPDTRRVFLVQHPVHGRCMLKTRFALRSPRSALADQALAEVIAEAQSPLFPQVYAATPDYTLEQYIDGTPFRQWVNESFDAMPIEAFFSNLKQWSTSGGPWSSQGNLRPYEIRETCESYIRKCLRHTGYFSRSANLRCLSRLSRGSGAITKQLQWLAEASEQVQMPRGVMCGDMGNVNIIVERETNRLVNVDYEYMGPGHWGFDCSYLIASLEKIGGVNDATTQMREMALSEAQLETAECAAFFRAYTDLLSAISQTIYARC